MRSQRSGLGGRIAVAIVVAASLTGCTAQEGDEPAPASSTAQPAPSASASASVDIREDLVGDWVSPDDPDVTLTLRPDGTMVGFDGCNTHSGTWSDLSGGAIRLQFESSTEKGCPEDFDAWLALSDGAMALDSTLGLYGPADGPTGTVVRVDG
jgi:heat shock protein HslJ